MENKTESMFAICHPKGYLEVEILKAFSVTADYASLKQSPYLHSSEWCIQSNSKLFKCLPNLQSAFVFFLLPNLSPFSLSSLFQMPHIVWVPIYDVDLSEVRLVGDKEKMLCLFFMYFLYD